MAQESASTPPPGSISTDLFIDWAKPRRADGSTKGIGVIGVGEKKVSKFTLEELRIRFLPPRRLFIEGIPTIRRDELLDAGYEVYYCNTRALPEIRRSMSLDRSGETARAVLEVPSKDYSEAGSGAGLLTEGLLPASEDTEEEVNAALDELEQPHKKEDSTDPRALRDFAARIRWYKAERSEWFVVEAMRLFKNYELLVAESKLAAQLAASESYMDTEFFARQQAFVESERRKAEAAIGQFCRKLGLHQHHTRVYGVGCVTAVAGLMRRPWAFGKGAWRHYNGTTHHARYDDIVTRHSLGCDPILKSLCQGAIMALLRKTSPYRKIYDDAKARLPTYTKRGKAGRGTYKVTSHARAVNRVVTKVIDEIRKSTKEWYKSTGSGTALPSGVALPDGARGSAAPQTQSVVLPPSDLLSIGSAAVVQTVGELPDDHTRESGVLRPTAEEAFSSVSQSINSGRRP